MNSDKSGLFITVMEAHKGIIFKIANLYSQNQEDRKDLVQEVFLQLWKSFDKYNKQYKYSTWIYKIALNVAISFYRKEKTRASRSNSFTEDILQVVDVNENAGIDEKTALLWKYLNTLSELDKALILLYLEGKTHKEIVEIMGISETNVATKISRIKSSLRQKISNLIT